MKHILSYNEKFFSGFADKVGQLLTGEERKVQGTEVKFPEYLKNAYLERLFAEMRDKHPKMTAFVKKISFDFSKYMSGGELDIFDAYVTPCGLRQVQPEKFQLIEGQFGNDLWLMVSYDSKNNKQITEELLDEISNAIGKRSSMGYPLFRTGNRGGKDFILVNHAFAKSLVY